MGPSRTTPPLWAKVAALDETKAILCIWVKPWARLVAVPATVGHSTSRPPNTAPAVLKEILPVLVKASVESESAPFRT